MTSRMTRFVATAMLVAAASTSGVGAQSSGQTGAVARYLDEARGLTIDQLVALALEKAPAMLAARAQVEVARGDLTQAGLRPNPMISFEQRDEIGGMDNQSAVGVVWPLDVFRKTGRTNVARQQVAGAEHQEADSERVLAVAVRLRAARLLALVRQLDVRERMSRAARETRDLLAARAESGAGTPLDRDIADVEWRRAEAEVVRQRADVDVTAAELKALAGLPPDAPLLLRDTLEATIRGGGAVSATAADAAAIARAVDARPDVRAAGSQVALASARTDLIRREARPEVSVTAAYMRMDAGFAQLGLDPGGQPAPIRGLFHNVAIGAMVTLPWRNRQQGAVAASVASEAVARHALEALRLTAGAELEAARLREQQARRVWEIYSGGLRDLAARNLNVIRESHQLGRATLVDVLAETRRYLDVETAYTEAMLEMLTARIALASAMGVTR